MHGSVASTSRTQRLHNYGGSSGVTWAQSDTGCCLAQSSLLQARSLEALPLRDQSMILLSGPKAHAMPSHPGVLEEHAELACGVCLQDRVHYGSGFGPLAYSGLGRNLTCAKMSRTEHVSGDLEGASGTQSLFWQKPQHISAKGTLSIATSKQQ